MGWNFNYGYVAINFQNMAPDQAGSTAQGPQAPPQSSIQYQHAPTGPTSHKSSAKTITIAVISVLVIVGVLYVLLGFSSGKISLTTTTIYLSNTSTQNPSVSSSNYSSCASFVVSQSVFNSVKKGVCKSRGGYFNLYYGAGDSGKANITITNIQTNKSIISILNSTETCSVYSGTYNLSPADYLVELKSGTGGGACGSSFVGLSST